MKKISFATKDLKKLITILSTAIVFLFIALVAFRLITGRSLGIRGYLAWVSRPITSPVKSIINHQEIIRNSQGDFTNIIFLHHSTGRNLINQGQIREELTDAGYDFWDHDYNPIGLRNPLGEYTGYDYRVPDDNTNPDGLAKIFSQPVSDLPINTLNGLLQHEVIIIKSCFAPANHITSDAQLDQYKKWYFEIRDTMDKHPDKIFILMTIPPLNPAETNPEEATRAKKFANFLTSNEFLDGHQNVFTFDFYEFLSEDDPDATDFNMLREEYREGSDSHPNQVANETIGPILVDFVTDVVEDYRVKFKSTN